jgi:hypothetical protein
MQTVMAKMMQLCLQMSHLTSYGWTKALEAMVLFTYWLRLCLHWKKKCNGFSPWTRQYITREASSKQFSDASCAWAIEYVMQLSPSADTSPQEDDSSKDQYALTSPTK